MAKLIGRACLLAGGIVVVSSLSACCVTPPKFTWFAPSCSGQSAPPCQAQTALSPCQTPPSSPCQAPPCAAAQPSFLPVASYGYPSYATAIVTGPVFAQPMIRMPCGAAMYAAPIM